MVRVCRSFPRSAFLALLDQTDIAVVEAAETNRYGRKYRGSLMISQQ